MNQVRSLSKIFSTVELLLLVLFSGPVAYSKYLGQAIGEAKKAFQRRRFQCFLPGSTSVDHDLYTPLNIVPHESNTSREER